MSENLESLQEGFYLKNKELVYLKRDGEGYLIEETINDKTGQKIFSGNSCAYKPLTKYQLDWIRELLHKNQPTWD